MFLKRLSIFTLMIQNIAQEKETILRGSTLLLLDLITHVLTLILMVSESVAERTGYLKGEMRMVQRSVGAFFLYQ